LAITLRQTGQGMNAGEVRQYPGRNSMRRLMMMAGALGVALVMSSGAFAQVPADPNNPNENVPEAQPNTPYGEPINLETAKKVAAAASAEAAKRKWAGMCIAIVSPSGDLVYFEKPDLCQYASVTISQTKARAAARYRRPTVVFERLIGKGQFFAYLPTLGDAFIGSRGGNPIVVGGKLIGAIGVSGGTGSQDDTISQAGAASMK
jgi:glc operon protein GlcG